MSKRGEVIYKSGVVGGQLLSDFMTCVLVNECRSHKAPCAISRGSRYGISDTDMRHSTSDGAWPYETGSLSERLAPRPGISLDLSALVAA